MDPSPRGEDHVFLIARTTLKEYLGFMTTKPVGAEAADRGGIADEWRAAHDYFFDLRLAERTWADNVVPAPLPDAVVPLAERVAADPVFRTAFAVMPTSIGLIELDRLVVSQKTINLPHVQRLKDRLGPRPSLEEVFHVCLPFDHPPVDCRVGRSGSDVVFVSHSEDLRFLESVVLPPDRLPGFRSFGPVAGVVGLVVGFGSGYLNAVACEGRMVLNNGYHRAYALRELGVTHVPAVIQQILRPDEMNAAGGAAFRRDPEYFLRSPRPPVLKDYFDLRLSKVVRMVPTAHHVRVRFTIEEADLPA